MCDAAAETGRGWVLGEGEDVVPTRSLSVDESISTPVLTQTKDLLVEPQRASQVPDGEIDVRKAVSLNHKYLEILSRSPVFVTAGSYIEARTWRGVDFSHR